MRLHRFLFLLFACCALGPPVLAQTTITTTSPANQCASVDVTNKGSVGIHVGPSTWTGALQAEIGIQGQTPSNINVIPYGSATATAQSTITANGDYYTTPIAAGSSVLVCGPTTTGTATVWLNTSTARNSPPGGGGGGTNNPGGTSGQIQSNGGSVFSAFTANQDATINTSTGAVTVQGLQGSALPSLSTGYLNYTGAALAFTPLGPLSTSTGLTGFLFGNNTSAPSAATSAQLGSLFTPYIAGLTGCTTSGFVYTPAGTDCVAQSGGGPPLGTAAQLPVMNIGATAYAPVTVSQDGTMTVAGALTVKGIDTVPLCTGFAPTNGQALEYATGGSPNPCYQAVTPTGSGNTTSTSMVCGQVVVATGTNSQVSSTSKIDVTKCAGSTLDVQLNNAITASPTAAGLIFSVEGAAGGTFLTTPWASNSGKSGKVLFGGGTYVMCQPFITPQPSWILEGMGVDASSAANTILQAGSSGNCGGTAWPQSTAGIVIPYQHGSVAAGTYYSVLNISGNVTSGSPIGTVDAFGTKVRNLTIDGNNLANFGVFTSNQEEQGMIDNVHIVNVLDGCVFGDRAFNIGLNNGGGAGPTHFDTTGSNVCQMASTINNRGYGLQYEGNPLLVTFSGGTCSTTPQAYASVSGGSPVSAGVVTVPGNCSAAPTCTLNTAASGTTGGACTPTFTGTALTSIAFASGTNWPNSTDPGGGPRFEHWTIRGSSGTNRIQGGVYIDGAYDAHVSDIHVEWDNVAALTLGSGNSAYTGGVFQNIDNGTGSNGPTVLMNPGQTSVETAQGDALILGITRVGTSGNVLVDHNPSSTVTLATSDSPCGHQTVALYTTSMGAAPCAPGTNGQFWEWENGAGQWATPSGSGTVTASPQFQMATFPNAGTTSVVAGHPNVTADSLGNLTANSFIGTGPPSVVGSIPTSTISPPGAGNTGISPDTSGNWGEATGTNANANFLTVLTGVSAIANGTAAMGTSAVSSGTCASAVTVSAPGVATTDVITTTPNVDPTGVTGYAPSANGSLYIQAYPTSGNVSFKVCNDTSASITPSALTLNWKVVR